jgi:hypothetical protein
MGRGPLPSPTALDRQFTNPQPCRGSNTSGEAVITPQWAFLALLERVDRRHGGAAGECRGQGPHENRAHRRALAHPGVGPR